MSEPEAVPAANGQLHSLPITPPPTIIIPTPPSMMMPAPFPLKIPTPPSALALTPSTSTIKPEPSEKMDVQGEDAGDDAEEDEILDGDEDIEDEVMLDDLDGSSPDRRIKGGTTTGRAVTLQMLLGEGILQPGEGSMSIDYLGQKFIGDLLTSGKIKSQETTQVFGSPSAWAIYCKKIVNPDKKSGCGWASVKYKGKKLDAYKTHWFKKKRLNQNKENEGAGGEGGVESQSKVTLTGSEEETDSDKEPPAKKEPPKRIAVKHHILGNRNVNHDATTLVESLPFSSLGKIQPFTVSLTSSSLLVMDLHSHLSQSEVVGYLAGHWDVNAHNLAVTQAFPCLCRLGERHETTSSVEAAIARAVEARRLTLVGWYHSHPQAAATPTLRDIDAQMEYQIKMKGSSDASYTPCIGVICSPYNSLSESLESSISSYWVMPPPESRPQEYGRPMLMTYSVVRDQYLSQEALEEMRHCAGFYRQESDYINFGAFYKERITYWEKLKAAATRHCPRELRREQLFSYLRDLLHLGGQQGLTGKADGNHKKALVGAPLGASIWSMAAKGRADQEHVLAIPSEKQVK